MLLLVRGLNLVETFASFPIETNRDRAKPIPHRPDRPLDSPEVPTRGSGPFDRTEVPKDTSGTSPAHGVEIEEANERRFRRIPVLLAKACRRKPLERRSETIEQLGGSL